MSHNLYGERFYNSREKPWHSLGHVSETEMSASQAFELSGPYEVTLQPVYYERNGVYVPVPGRFAITNENNGASFGLVGSTYGLITPRQFCETWDQVVTAPVETLGALGHGETIFLSTKLPTFAVRGDEIEMYLLAVNPMNGVEAAKVMVTPVRVVCQNMLNAAKKSTQESFRIIHDRSVVSRYAVWLEHAWGRAQMKAEALKEAFEVLAAFKVQKEHTEQVLNVLYEEPQEPVFGALVGREERDKEMNLWNRRYEAAQKQRRGVYNLFAGEGRGSDAEAFKGTAYGFYNAVVEYEDFGRASRKGVNADESLLFGSRAETKEKAYEMLTSMAR